MQQPAGDQVFRDREFRKATDACPCCGTKDKSAARAPCGVDTITITVLCTSAGGVPLIQRIIVRDVVVEL